MTTKRNERRPVDTQTLPNPTAELVASVARDLPNLKSAREALELSQTDVAERCGVTRGAVCRWETGQRTPRGLAASVLRGILDSARPTV